MKLLVLMSATALVGASAAFVAGCSSDPPPSTTAAGPGGGGGGPSGSGATGGASGGSSTTTAGGAQGGASGAGGHGGAGEADAGPTSKACADYCDCYQTKCSVFVPIPGGAPCLDFCATFTAEQYECRFNMCFWNSNGPRENNNDHCQHTVGINECL